MDFTSILGFLLVLLLAFATVWLISVSLLNGIGPVPTSLPVKHAVEKLLPEQVSGDIVELGAGWGSMAIFLARYYPENRVVAVENNLPVFLACWLRAKLSRCTNLSVRFSDIYQYSNNNTGLVYCYLCTQAMEKLAAWYRKYPGEMILISNTFSLPGWHQCLYSDADDIWRSRVYCYRMPAPELVG